MTGEISGDFGEQAANSKTLTGNLAGVRSGLPEVSGASGVDPRHTAALSGHADAGKAAIEGGENTGRQGTNATTDLDETDKKNKGKFGDGKGLDKGDGGKGGPPGDRGGKISPSSLSGTNPLNNNQVSNAAPSSGIPSGGAGSGGGMPQMPQMPSGGGGMPQMPLQSMLSGSPNMLKNSLSQKGDFGPASMNIDPNDPDKLRKLAQAQVDKHIPYAWGGGGVNGPGKGITDHGGPADAHGDYKKIGFDCSGLSQYMVHQMEGKTIPRTSEAQWAASHHISASQARPGDLVFMSFKSQGPGHVAVYLGNNQMLEAPSSGQYVKISPLRGGQFGRI